MNQLIKITTNEQGLQVVSARELYEGLGFDLTSWAKWYKKNIENNPFAIENQDWSSLVQSPSESKRGNFAKDFALTLDFAKRLSMMARTEKGEEIRNYFIACEQKAISKPQLPTNFIESLEMLLEAKKNEQKLTFELENKTYELEKATEVIKEQAPAVEYTQKVLQSTETYTTTQIAKELDMTADKLYNILMNRGILFKQSGTYMLYGKYQGKNLSKVRTHSFTGSTGEPRSNSYLVWTEKGREFIHRQVNSNLNYALVHPQIAV